MQNSIYQSTATQLMLLLKMAIDENMIPMFFLCVTDSLTKLKIITLRSSSFQSNLFYELGHKLLRKVPKKSLLDNYLCLEEKQMYGDRHSHVLSHELCVVIFSSCFNEVQKFILNYDYSSCIVLNQTTERS